MISLSGIKPNQSFTAEQLARIRALLVQHLGSQTFSVVVTGSYGRHEAGPGSDIDYFVIGRPTDREAFERADLPSILEPLGAKRASSGGPFETFVEADELVRRIGLDADTNAITTRRLLFLLECEWLYNEAEKRRLFAELIENYVADNVPDGALARFLINDIIRYYRTISVDFEVKTRRGQNKAWAPRRLKLVFSRKLLYFGGIVAAAETAGRPVVEKRALLVDLLQRPPLERLDRVFGPECSAALQMYDAFLTAMGDQPFRKWLETVGPEDRTDTELRRLLDLGKDFSRELIRLVHHRYPADHPLHEALLM